MEMVENLLAAKQSAGEDVDRVRSCDRLTERFLYENLRRYILKKFLLSEREAVSDDLDELSKISLQKQADLPLEAVEEEARDCTGATTVMVKKALLYMAVQKDFEVALDPTMLAKTKTILELTGAVYKQISAKEMQENKNHC